MAEPVLQPGSEESDLFYWRSRLVRTVGADGGSYLAEVPLTRSDILDPQEGDMMMQGPVYDLVARTLADMLDRWFNAEDVAVYHDVKISWGIAGLPDPAPDISVIKGVRDKLADRASFSVPDEGVRPCLVIELISPRSEEIDRRDKVRIYEQAGGPEYLIIDVRTTPARLDAFRLDPAGRYLPCPPERFESHTTGLCFRPGSEHLEIIVEDTATSERLLTSRQEAERRKEAEQRAAREAEARSAEARARRAEAEARRAAEQRAAELEAELKRLRKSGGRSEE